MKITYCWLKDFLKVKLTPEALAQKLTMAGLEVVGLEKTKTDTVLEIEITSNRPDWLSVLGVAREVSALTQEKLKLASQLKLAPVGKNKKSQTKSIDLKLQVQSKKDCPFYSARIICDLKVGPSPDWLKSRLELLGCRSVNNVVDITNYILFTYGQPLHAFDLDLLTPGTLTVRRAVMGEEIVLIGGEKKLLGPEILVIADKQKPVALAGVMGGKSTEVTLQTHNILLESAVFNPILVRQAKQKLGLQSESAYRFERGVDPEMAKLASQEAARLITQVAGGKVGEVKFSNNFKFKPVIIKLNLQEANKLLGVNIAPLQAVKILRQLGLKIKSQSSGVLTVSVPSFRPDLKLAIDLVEELARIYGFDKIPQTFPELKAQKKIPSKVDLVSDLKSVLAALGLQEIITYSLIDRALLAHAQLQQSEAVVEILNPLSREQEILRPSLLPSLMRAVAFNLNQQQERISVFEIANIFLDHALTVQEDLFLGIALCGSNSFVTPAGVMKDIFTPLHLKGILERFFIKFGIKEFDFQVQSDNKFDVLVKGEKVGLIWDVPGAVLGAFEIKNRQVILGELNLEKLFKHFDLRHKFLPLPKYPAISRDISFIIKEDILLKDLIAKIYGQGSQLLQQVKVADYYQGKQIPAGFKGLTISCVYRALDRTLTEVEVNPIYNATCSLLEECFGAKLR